jgi:alpha-D-xyloside xylohydrolase
MKPDDLAEWRELQLRWFQMGAFVPVFRSHGQFPTREIWNIAPQGSEVYDSLVWHDRLRYRLMPYTYTLAADIYHRDGSIMRGLAMDFPDDAAARKVRDEYLFGKAFLVAPVYQYESRARQVYLPAGAEWYDFHSGAKQKGGQTIESAAPLARMPLYVRAGSVVPVGPDIQYTGEKPDAPITLFVFTGADGSFDYYEDDGVSYGYERGEFARIPLRYDAANESLVIGARAGSFKGMPAKRTFHVRWIREGARAPADLDAKADATVEYEGAEVTIKGK